MTFLINGAFLGSAFTNAATHFVRFEMDEEATEIRLKEPCMAFLYSPGS